MLFLALKIHCSSECKSILDTLGGYTLEERGLVSMKVIPILQPAVAEVSFITSEWQHKNALKFYHLSLLYHSYELCSLLFFRFNNTDVGQRWTPNVLGPWWRFDCKKETHWTSERQISIAEKERRVVSTNNNVIKLKICKNQNIRSIRNFSLSESI